MPTNPIPNPLTSNDQLLDALARHQTFLMRGAKSIRIDAVEILNATEDELAQLILRGLKGDSVVKDIKRSVRLLRLIKDLRNLAWRDIRKLLRKDFKEVVNNEYAFMLLAVATVLPTIPKLIPAPESLATDAVTNSVYEGKTLDQWNINLRNKDLDRIGNTIRTGIVQGSKPPQIARDVVGTKAALGRDGITQVSRRNIGTIVQTSMTNFATVGKEAFSIRNPDMIQKEIYVIILDNRTTTICISLDGNIYLVGEGRFPPVHIGCRSFRMAILNGQVIGKAPLKPRFEREFLKEFTIREKLPSVSKRIKLSRRNQFRFDSFARKRAQDLIGGAPNKIGYSEFLKRQSVLFQNETLGITKARLFRRGGLSVDKFVNRKGDELSLSQIAQRDPQAFKAAGLDPLDFTGDDI